MALSGILFSLITAFCWAVVPLIYRRNMVGITFQEMNAVRAFGFTGTMALILLVTRPEAMTILPSTGILLLILGSTILGNLTGDVLYMKTIQEIGVSKTVAITSVYPLIVTAVSVIWLHESITVKTLAGTVAIIVGLNFLRKETGETSTLKGSSGKGFLMGMLTALCWGLSIPVTRWILLNTSLDSVTLNYWRGLIFLPATWFVWSYRSVLGLHPWKRVFTLTRRNWLELNSAGAIALAIGGTFLTLALKMAPASIVTPITASSPLISTLLAVVLLGEKVTHRQWLGVILIIIGSTIINF